MRVTRARGQRIGVTGLWAVGVVFCGAWTAQPVRGQNAMEDDARTILELGGMGKRGEEIIAARDVVLKILSSGNGCAVWFQEAGGDPAEVFRALRFRLEEKSKAVIDSTMNDSGQRLYKHPWAARTDQGAGTNSVVTLNAHGAFFVRSTQVMYVDMAGNFVGPGDRRALALGRYPGGSREAQVVTLLHELGHALALLPADDDSWNGRSSQNTDEVLRHCEKEIHWAVKRAALSRAEMAKNR